MAVNIDDLGSVYVVGTTASTNFPTTTGAFQGNYAGGSGNDTFVVKFDTNLTSLLASTYLGGSDDDSGGRGGGIFFDTSSSVYVIGFTLSTNFPTTTGCYQALNGGGNDIFVTKFTSGLTSTVASTYLGGNTEDGTQRAFVTATGTVYLAGQTASTNFPTTTGAYQANHFDGYDGFVSVLNSSLTSLIASTYFGSTANDYPNGIAIDSAGNIYVAGYTTSITFPTTTGAYQGNLGNAAGTNDAFISKFNPSLTTLLASTYLGGTGAEAASSVAVDSNNNIYVVGYAQSTNFPTTTGAYQGNLGNAAGTNDGFISKI